MFFGLGFVLFFPKSFLGSKISDLGTILISFWAIEACPLRSCYYGVL